MNNLIDSHTIKQFLSAGAIDPGQMRRIDRNATALGVSTLQLMEGAGHALAGVIRRYNPERVLILCGSGNNGGDGMVAARLLAHETEVTVLCYEGPRMTHACRVQREALLHCAVNVHAFRCQDDIRSLLHLFSQSDLIVDAMLGTGVSGILREPLTSCVTAANESGKPIISADTPTPGIHPTIICAFHRAKIEGSEIHSIGIPILAEICTGPGDLLLLPERSSRAHKGDGGTILIIGGGPYQGAPYLAGLGALRAGADIVRVASPSALPFPDLIHEPMSSGWAGEEDIERLIPLCRKADVVVCGMGLGPNSHQMVTTLAPYCSKAVFDADALRLPLPKAAHETLYTPHAGEFTRMTGIIPEEETSKRAEAIRTAQLPGTVLLKGEIDIITYGDKIRFNRTGSPAMTTGGTGDVLSGVCGALCTRLSAFDAACIGAYVTGRAGEMVADKIGYGLTAQDLLPVIPQILYNRIAEDYI
ncbi:MAG: NAD(P)H-hydrate dehydratase [Methanobacteriota archaeon]